MLIRFVLKTSFHCLLSFTFVTFYCPLSLLFQIFPDVNPALSVLDLHEIYSGVVPLHVYCVVCYRVIAAPYVRSVIMFLHTVTLLMTIRNAQWTMSVFSLLYF